MQTQLTFAVPLALALACAATDPDVAPSSNSPMQVSANVLELPEDWDTADFFAFERLALAWPRGEPARLGDADLAALASALATPDPDAQLLAVRAAVLLARSNDLRAIDVLLARLEQRAFGADRTSDSGDVTAAAALRGFERASLDDRNVPERLVALCTGAMAHPDLEVRVEIAATALELDRDAPIPFLLDVLRAGTAPEPWPDFERKQTLAWSKTRAAAALTTRAATDLRFEPDGPYADQRAEAARLEKLLLAPR